MGGNAIKKVKISRISKCDYQLIKQNIFDLLSNDFQLEFIFDLPEKEDFGDLDILYLNINNKNIVDFIIQHFNPNEIVYNGNVISFDYKLIKDNQSIYFQIDLIKTQNINMAKFYFSYGDIGSILGLIAKRYNLVFGFDGLWINTKLKTIVQYLKNKNIDDIDKSFENINEDYNFGKIILTNNPEQICEYLDFDYQKWKNGFNNNYEIFQWIIKSKYFQKNIFYQTNREHRENIKKRTFYNFFIENNSKLEDNDNNNNINQLNSIEYFKKENELNNLIENFKLNNERKDKFNAHIFKEYGIEDKKLGENICEFKKYILQFNPNFEEWLDTNNKNDIKNIVFNFLKSH